MRFFPVLSLLFSLSFFPLSLKAEDESSFRAKQPVSAIPSKTPSWACQIDNECLNELYNGLLNKESESSVYQACQSSFNKSKACCASPSQCREDFGKEIAQTLKQHSLRAAGQQNCQANPALRNILSEAQRLMCKAGVEHCQESCEEKLQELKKAFKQCFFIPFKDSVETALEKAKKSSNLICYQEMRNIADRYKSQSLNESSLFKEELKARDIVNCKEMEREKNLKNLRDLTLNFCHQDQEKNQEEEESAERQQKLKEQTLEFPPAQEEDLEQNYPATAQPNQQSLSDISSARASEEFTALPSLLKDEDKNSPAPDILLETTPISVVFPLPEIYYKAGGKSLSILIRAIDERGNIKERLIKELKDKPWREGLYF